MTFSKSRILLLAVSLAVAACSTESQRKHEFDHNNKVKDFQSEKGTTFYVGAFTIPAGSVTVVKGTNGIIKKKIYNFSACLKDQGGAAVQPPGLMFRVSDDAGSSRDIAINRDGCLIWSEEKAYSHTSEAGWIQLKRRISAVERYRGSVLISVPFNPWTDAIWDTRVTDIPYTVMDAGPVPMDSNMRLGASSAFNVNLETVSFAFRGLNYDKYDITPYLQLKVAHDYQIKLKPTVIRKVLTNFVQEPLVGGSIRVYVAIFKERKNSPTQFHQDNLIFADQFVLHDNMSVGTYSGDVTLKFDDIAALTSRTAALVTLEVEGGELPEINFSGVLSPGRLAALNLVPSTVSARVMAERAQELARQHETVRPLDFFVQKTGFREVPAGTVVTSTSFFGGRHQIDVRESLLNFVESKKASLGKREVEALCQTLFAEGDTRRAGCLRRPDLHLSYGRREFVEAVRSAPRRVGMTTVETMKMGMSFAIAKSRSTATAKSVTAGAGLSLGLGIGYGNDLWSPTVGQGQPKSPITPLNFSAGLKLNAGGNISWAREWKDTDSHGATLSVGSELSVTSEGNAFELDVTTRGCALVVAQPKMLLPSEISLGLYVCSDKTVEKSITESYYLVGQNIGQQGSPFSDSESNAETSWRTLVRGRHNALFLYELVKNTKTKLVLESLPDEEMLEDFKHFQAMQDYPGIVSP